MALESINPATGELLRTYEEMSVVEAREIVERCAEAQRAWRETTFSFRAECLRKAAAILRERENEHARRITLEMGKPVKDARAEVGKCAAVCDFYAENGERFLADELVETEARKSFVAFEPLGVVLAVMPWNFPYWQVFRFAAPALMAGNGAVLKHASNVSGCALGIEAVFREAGFPEDLFRTLLVRSGAVDDIIAHREIRAVTLTGSVEAGRAVARKAGAELKKIVLELGGSDPYLVFEDADLELAARVCATSRLINTGQSCIAAKRFIVVEGVRARFLELLVEEMRGKCLDDPMNPATEIGPLARADLRDDLHAQVEASVKAGAKRLLGAEPLDRPGNFYLPGVLADVRPGMPAFDEELFGPVAAVISAADEEEAIALANRSVFGLGSGVFTRDLDRAERVARRLEAGNCFVNTFVKSDPRMPFGGVKDSGFGRELGRFGIREFVNVKSVVIA